MDPLGGPADAPGRSDEGSSSGSGAPTQSRPPEAAAELADLSGLAAGSTRSVFTEFDVSVVDPPAPLSEIVSRYDANGRIDIAEHVQTLNDAMAKKISYAELMEVVRAYQAS